MSKLNQCICIFLLGLTLLVSCKKDKDDPSSNFSDTNFKNQKLSGKIDNQDWNFIYGNAQFIGNKKITFNLYNVPAEDSCNLAWATNQAFFTTDSLVGSQKFSFTKTVTLFASSGKKNYIVTSGGIEITEIDTKNNLIKGKLDAPSSNSSSYINGNFVVKICGIN